MEGGADVEIVEARGRTARESARWRDQIDVELWLQDAEQVVEARIASEENVGSEEGSWDGDEGDELASPMTTIKPSRRDIGDVGEFNLSSLLSVLFGSQRMRSSFVDSVVS